MIFQSKTQSTEQAILEQIQSLSKDPASLNNVETRNQLLQLSEKLTASLRAPEDVTNEVAYYVSTSRHKAN